MTIEGGLLRPLRDRLIDTSTFVPILAVAIAGLWLRRRDARREAVLWCILITFVAVHAIFFPATRGRTPMEFVLLFYAAVTLDALISRLTPVA